MTTDSLEEHADEGRDAPVPTPGRGRRRIITDDLFPEPTAGMVLHRVLAMAARTFLLNDTDDTFDARAAPTGAPATVDALTLSMGTRPLWAQSAADSLRGTERREDPTERVHQTRVAMRRIRSNLRTYRLLLDPGWGTRLRAELAWYGNELGRYRDLELLAEVIGERAPGALAPDEVARLQAVVDWRKGGMAAAIAAERVGARHDRLTGQMMALWEGPEFKSKAARPAGDVLPPMLHRSWHDLRAAARAARKDPSDVHLHQVRIRLKDLRYGAETLAMVEGAPARKTAKAAERLQAQLGELHDAVFSIAWLEALAAEQPDLADAAERLVAVQRDVAGDTRKGWKGGIKEVERRWRRWQG